MFNIIVWFFYFLKSFKGQCYDTLRLIQYEQNFDYKTGPQLSFAIDHNKLTTGKFTITFWMKFDNLPQDKTGTILQVFRLQNENQVQQNYLSLEVNITSQTSCQLQIASGTQITQIAKKTSNKDNVWIFYVISQDTIQKQIEILEGPYNDKNSYTYDIAFTQNWIFDNTLNLKFGAKDDDIFYFHGLISRADFIYNLDHNESIDLSNLRKDFSEAKYTQKFYNKIENSYQYALNGRYNTTDIYDMDFVDNFGFSNSYGHQVITLPQFREYQVEPSTFSFFLKLQVSFIDKDIDELLGQKNHGIIHRYKDNGSSVSNRYLYAIRLRNFSQFQIYRTISGNDDIIKTISTNQSCIIKRINL